MQGDIPTPLHLQQMLLDYIIACEALYVTLYRISKGHDVYDLTTPPVQVVAERCDFKACLILWFVRATWFSSFLYRSVGDTGTGV